MVHGIELRPKRQLVLLVVACDESSVKVELLSSGRVVPDKFHVYVEPDASITITAMCASRQRIFRLVLVNFPFFLASNYRQQDPLKNQGSGLR